MPQYKNKRKRFGYHKVSAIIPEITTDILGGKDKTMARLMASWPEIVGSEISALCSPVKYTAGRGNAAGSLQLQTYDSYALELQHLEPVIIEKISVYLGHKTIGRLKFIQSPGSSMQKYDKNLIRKKVAKRKKIDYSHNSKEFKATGIDKISDEDLSGALQKLYNTIEGD